MKKINIKRKNIKRVSIIVAIIFLLFTYNAFSKLSNSANTASYKSNESMGSILSSDIDGSSLKISEINADMSVSLNSNGLLSSGNDNNYDSVDSSINSTDNNDINSTDNNDTSSSKEKGNKIIITTDVTLETLEYEKTIKAIEDKVKDVNGYIESSDIEGTSIYEDSNNRRYAYFTLRIPKDKLDEFNKGINEAGKIVENNTQSEDVSANYFDKEARLETLKIQEDRILDILSKSTKLEDILDLESRLSDIRYEIESITTTLNKLNNLVEYSTVKIKVKEIKKSDTSLIITEATFLEQMKNTFNRTMSTFILTIESIILAIIALSPYIVITILLYILLRKKISKFVRNNFNIYDDSYLETISNVENKPKKDVSNEDVVNDKNIDLEKENQEDNNIN